MLFHFILKTQKCRLHFMYANSSHSFQLLFIIFSHSLIPVKAIFCGNFSNISVQIYTLSSWEPKSTLCKQNVHTLYSFYSWFWVKAILCCNFAIYFNFSANNAISFSLFNLLLCKHVRSTRNGPTIRWPLFSCLQSSQLHLFWILLQGQSSKLLNHQVANNANVYSQTFHIIQSHIDSFNILNPPISSIDK